MATLHPDNFGFYGTSHVPDYYTATGTYEVGLVGPFGGPGLKFLDDTASLQKSGLTATGKFISGVERYLPTLPGTRKTLLSFGLSGTVHVKIDVNPNGTLSIRRGDDVQIASSSLALPMAQPFHLNVEVEVSNAFGTVLVLVTTNGATSVYVNASGVDTQNGSSALWNEATHAAVVAHSTIGNLILQDSSGGGATAAMLGPNAPIRTFRPVAPGAHSQFTHRVGSVDNYQNVADPSDVTYNGTDQPAVMDTFKMQRIEDPVLQLHSATLIIRARKGGTREKKIAPVIRHAGVDVIGPAVQLTPAFKPYATTYEILPDGYGWTVDRWNNIEFGYADATAPGVDAWAPVVASLPVHRSGPVTQEPSVFRSPTWPV